MKQHWPLLGAIAVWGLVLKFAPWAETLRAAASIASIALLVYQGIVYRKRWSGARLPFLPLMLPTFGMASLWMLLNVIRYYPYDPESKIASRWHDMIADTQHMLLCPLTVLAVIVGVWAIVDFARRLAGRIRHV